MRWTPPYAGPTRWPSARTSRRCGGRRPMQGLQGGPRQEPSRPGGGVSRATGPDLHPRPHGPQDEPGWGRGAPDVGAHAISQLSTGRPAAHDRRAGRRTPSKSTLFDVPDAGFGYRTSKVQRQVLGEVRGARPIALENRASNLLPDNQRRRALRRATTTSNPTRSLAACADDQAGKQGLHPPGQDDQPSPWWQVC